MAGQHSVEAGLEWRLERKGRLHSGRFTCAKARADFRRARDDGLAHDARSPGVDDSDHPAALTEDAFRTIHVKNKGRRCLRGHGDRYSSTRTTRRGKAPLRAKVPGCRRACDDCNDTVKDTLGEAGEDGNHEGGVSSDHEGRLLQGAARLSALHHRNLLGRKVKVMIIGLFMVIGNFRGPGPVSPNSPP